MHAFVCLSPFKFHCFSRCVVHIFLVPFTQWDQQGKAAASPVIPYVLESLSAALWESF